MTRRGDISREGGIHHPLDHLCAQRAFHPCSIPSRALPRGGITSRLVIHGHLLATSSNATLVTFLWHLDPHITCGEGQLHYMMNNSGQ